MGQQFFEPLDRMVSDATGNISEPGKQIDLHQFAGSDEAAQNRRCLTSVIAAEEGPVIPSDRKAPQRPRGAVIVDQEIVAAASVVRC